MTEIVCYGMIQPVANIGNYVFYFGGENGMTKPTTWDGFDVGQGSLFLELDTGTFFYFDGSDWAEVGA